MWAMVDLVSLRACSRRGAWRRSWLFHCLCKSWELLVIGCGAGGTRTGGTVIWYDCRLVFCWRIFVFNFRWVFCWRIVWGVAHLVSRPCVWWDVVQRPRPCVLQVLVKLFWPMRGFEVSPWQGEIAIQCYVKMYMIFSENRLVSIRVGIKMPCWGIALVVPSLSI